MSYRTDTLAISDAPLDIRKAWPLYADLVDIERPSTRPVIDHRLKGEGNGFIRFLTLLETKQPDGTDRKGQMVLSGRKFRYRRQARERSDADSEPTATGI